MTGNSIVLISVAKDLRVTGNSVVLISFADLPYFCIIGTVITSTYVLNICTNKQNGGDMYSCTAHGVQL